MHYFKGNMEGLGLLGLESFFGTLPTTVATMGELISACTRLEKLAIIGACSAAYYVRAVIGGIARRVV